MKRGYPMAKRTRNADEETMLSAWDWAKDVEKLIGRNVRWQIYPDVRRGTFKLVCQVLETADNKPVGYYVKYTEDWPSSQIHSLGAALMRVAMGVDHTMALDDLEDGKRRA
jgi:hypothetical protein